LIVHFLQPHVPLIGETGLEIYQRIAAEGDLSALSRGGRGDRFGALNVQLYDIIESDEFDIDVADLRRAYVENLEIVLPSVDRLIRELDGKSVVSADHGELLGERLLPSRAESTATSSTWPRSSYDECRGTSSTRTIADGSSRTRRSSPLEWTRRR